MIYSIKGKLDYANESFIVIDNNGIGYKVFISGKFFERLPSIGSDIKVYTHMNIREDDISLYGFASQEELEIFKILLGINGVGPKAAISILTALTVQELYLAVISEDIKAITKANGIGTKGAQRIVLELKDKLKMEDMLDAAYDNSVGAAPQSQDVSGDVIMALTSLGYSQSEAVMAIRKVDNSSDMDTEQLLKAALKKMI
jgi:Holliday junction DNA helicase RuvA